MGRHTRVRTVHEADGISFDGISERERIKLLSSRSFWRFFATGRCRNQLFDRGIRPTAWLDWLGCPLLEECVCLFNITRNWTRTLHRITMFRQFGGTLRLSKTFHLWSLSIQGYKGKYRACMAYDIYVRRNRNRWKFLNPCMVLDHGRTSMVWIVKDCREFNFLVSYDVLRLI